MQLLSDHSCHHSTQVSSCNAARGRSARCVHRSVDRQESSSRAQAVSLADEYHRRYQTGGGPSPAYPLQNRKPALCSNSFREVGRTPLRTRDWRPPARGQNEHASKLLCTVLSTCTPLTLR